MHNYIAIYVYYACNYKIHACTFYMHYDTQHTHIDILSPLESQYSYSSIQSSVYLEGLGDCGHGFFGSQNSLIICKPFIFL